MDVYAVQVFERADQPYWDPCFEVILANLEIKGEGPNSIDPQWGGFLTWVYHEGYVDFMVFKEGMELKKKMLCLMDRELHMRKMCRDMLEALKEVMNVARHLLHQV